MYFLGTFAGQQATDQADHDDLDFFPFPTLGTEFDAELGIDAPIDGFMLSQGSRRTSTGAKAFLECFVDGRGADRVPGRRPEQRRGRRTTPTPAATPHPEEDRPRSSAASGAIAQFLDRDTDPGFAGAKACRRSCRTS